MMIIWIENKKNSIGKQLFIDFSKKKLTFTNIQKT